MTEWDAAPVDPGPNRWRLPDPRSASGDLIATGGNLEPGTIIAAYRRGLFPMPVRRNLLGWWSPDPRGIVPLDGLQVSRSLRRSVGRYEVRFDTCFREVIVSCADPARPHGWITPAFIEAYSQLHALGWAHSVETFDVDGRLVGGLYGLRVERLFAGESMFHRARDASKVALVALVERLRERGATLLDVQWATPHLVALGAIEIRRREYLRRLAEAVDRGGDCARGS